MLLFNTGLNSFWLKRSQKARSIILFIIFALLWCMNELHFVFYERGSLLLWLPVFLILYFQKNTVKDFSLYSLGGVALFYSNKKTSLLAWLAGLSSKLKPLYFALSSAVLLIASFFFKENLRQFYKHAILPRVHIWQAALEGAVQKPLFGHGFGTFAIDFPVYREHLDLLGGKINQHIVHGHNMFVHLFFELGLVGLLLLLALLYAVYKKAPRAFLPMLTILSFDAALVNFNQYLLAGLILMPFLIGIKSSFLSTLLRKIPQRLERLNLCLAFTLCLLVFVPSLLGHYYYDQKDLNNAIRWDSKHSLYYFMRGALSLNKDTVSSEKDFSLALNLSPNVSYFYGFAAAAKLANAKNSEAREDIAKALSYDGGDSYWYLLSAFANYDADHDLYLEHYKKALALNPDLEDMLYEPSITASEYIGSARSDVRIVSFYRRGPKVFLPLPYLEREEKLKISQ